MRIGVYADSGFGKSSSIGLDPSKGIEGLDPNETYLISMTSKDLPFPGSRGKYKVTTIDNLKGGNRIIARNAEDVINAMKALLASPYKNIVWDDSNYTMQDWYMANALSKGWDAPKIIGFNMGQIFDLMEQLHLAGKTIIMFAHPQYITEPDGRQRVAMKTTGKMVDEYVTPEGKLDMVILGKSRWDATNKKNVKEFITDETESYAGLKNGGVPLPLHMPNDMGKIVELAEAFFNGTDLD